LRSGLGDDRGASPEGKEALPERKILGSPRKYFDKKGTMQHDNSAERSKQDVGGAVATSPKGGGNDLKAVWK
jgi:hypothetical protein